MKTAVLFAFFVGFWLHGQRALEIPPPENYFVIEGDTIINNSIELKEVVLFQPLRFYNYEEAKNMLF